MSNKRIRNLRQLALNPLVSDKEFFRIAKGVVDFPNSTDPYPLDAKMLRPDDLTVLYERDEPIKYSLDDLKPPHEQDNHLDLAVVDQNGRVRTLAKAGSWWINGYTIQISRGDNP